MHFRISSPCKETNLHACNPSPNVGRFLVKTGREVNFCGNFVLHFVPGPGFGYECFYMQNALCEDKIQI